MSYPLSDIQDNVTNGTSHTGTDNTDRQNGLTQRATGREPNISTITSTPINGDVDTSEKQGSGMEKGANTSIVQLPVETEKRLIYKLTDTPPIHFLILFALQQACLAISTPLGTTVVVAEAVCAQDENDIKVRILSGTMMMMGLSTFLMVTLGVRLPIFQGPNATYIIPLVALLSLEEFKCPETFEMVDAETNKTILMAITGNGTSVPNSEIAYSRINEYAGSLMLAGLLHFFVGFTGLVGILARFVGPITIVPVVALFGIFIQGVVVSFAETYWPVSILTAAICIILALYLGNRMTPIPFWTPKKGFHVLWQPVQQIFALLISIIVGCIVSYILTETGVLSDDKNSKEYDARTDARIDVINDTPWFIFPYPGQFGFPSFNLGALITFIIATILSVLDSIGDYNATAKVSFAPPPPLYAINRGIAVEGAMSILGGGMGCGHATVSYGENIGAIGLSKVASRSVFMIVGVLYVIFSILGKFGAFFISIPYSVVGGSQFITFGLLIGVVLSYLQNIDLNSTRNLSIIGMSLLLGIMTPQYIQNNPDIIDTGDQDGDNVINLLLSNPSFIGGAFAFILDNTVPGTKEERGISVQMEELEVSGKQENAEFLGDSGEEEKQNIPTFENGPEIYLLPFIPDSFRGSKIAKYIPLISTKTNSQLVGGKSA